MMVCHRHVIGILPSCLDKRAHLGEQQGVTANPQRRGRGAISTAHCTAVTAPSRFGAQIGGGLSHSQPLAHPMARSDCRTYATNAIDMVA